MSRLRRFIVLCLVAVWLPSTLHCAMEAAGLLEIEDCCETDAQCPTVKCDAVESTVAVPTATTLSVKAPCLSCACLICVIEALEVPLVAVAASAEWRVASPPPPVWSFEHRLAPPARAPSAV